MAVLASVIDRVLFIRWVSTPDESDLTRMDEVMAQAAAVAGTKPFFHISVLPPGATMPESKVQKGLMRRILKLRSRCQTLHAVYPGTNVRDAVVRRFLKGMVTLMGMKGKAFVHATIAEAVTQIATGLEMPAADVVAAAEKLNATPA